MNKLEEKHITFKRPDRCQFCKQRMYYIDDKRHISEREIRVIKKSKKDYDSFYVHWKCWKAGLKIIKNTIGSYELWYEDLK